MNVRRPRRTVSAPRHRIVEQHRLRPAHLAATVFAAAFTVWTAVTLLLVLTIDVARSERLGFASVTGAAALAQWTVCGLLAQARRDPNVPGPLARAGSRLLTRLRTPRR